MNLLQVFEIAGGFTVDTLPDRILVSVVVAALIAIVGVFISPRISDWIVKTASPRILNRLGERKRSFIERYLSPELNVTLWLSVTMQTTLVFVGAYALLRIWGESQTAISMLGIVWQSLPEIGRFGASISIILCAYFGSVFIDRSLSRINETDRWNDHQARMVFRTLQVLMFGLLGVAFFSVWEVQIRGLLVGAGFLGIILGMATRQTIGALIAGFVLMFSRPFEIGDWVVIGDTKGVIIDITMVNTRLENQHGEIVVIPNDIVSETVLKNRTRKGRLRITVEVGVSYDATPEEVQESAEAAIERVDDVLAIPNPKAIPVRFGDSSIIYELQFWMGNPSELRRERTRASVIREVKQEFEQSNHNIPYPQREFTVKSGDESSPKRTGVNLSDFEDK